MQCLPFDTGLMFPLLPKHGADKCVSCEKAKSTHYFANNRPLRLQHQQNGNSKQKIHYTDISFELVVEEKAIAPGPR